MIAALFVARGGCYWDLPDVDAWDEHVEQWHYGHPAKKATWLYAFGCELPDLRWGSTPDRMTAFVSDGGTSAARAAERGPPAYVTDGRGDARRRGRTPQALISWCGNHVASNEVRPRLGKRAAAATPPEFRDLLIAMARTARGGDGSVGAGWPVR